VPPHTTCQSGRARQQEPAVLSLQLAAQGTRPLTSCWTAPSTQILRCRCTAAATAHRRAAHRGRQQDQGRKRLSICLPDDTPSLRGLTHSPGARRLRH
jgi:hypothetical protein